MRYYDNAKDMYTETERDLKEMGYCYTSSTVQDKQVEEETVELYGHVYRMKMSQEFLDDLYNLAIDKGIPALWMDEEIHERLNKCVNPGAAWINRSDLWNQYLRNKRFSYTYSERLFPQYDKILNELIQRMYTRQAVLTMFWPQDQDQLGGEDRVPCSLSYQFLVRQGELNLIYTMRSCDFYKFFLFDAYFAATLLKYYAEILGTGYGFFQHQIGSLHAFQKDLKHVF